MNRPSSPIDAIHQTDAPARWLPDFCSLPVLFALMLVAELVALIIMLAPGEEVRPFWPQLATASVFVQWLALVCALCLCKLKSTLTRMTPTAGMLLAYLLIIAITAIGSALVFAIDQALSLHFTPKDQSSQHFVLGNVAICALIAAALLRYFYVLEQWRGRMRAVAKAQFDALQARIRPHFLFNSMNTIASLIRTQPEDAEHAVENLSDLFRAALGADALSTLGVELELAHHYLEIERLRLGERLKIEWDVEALPLDLPLPTLLLQPLVENAVYHGIQALQEGGTVTIIGERNDNEVTITIHNPCPPQQESAPTGNGMALVNIRGRIEYHFGNRGSLDVNRGNDYFSCTVHLPNESSDRR